MKVLMIINSFRPLVGGAEKQAERLSIELVKKGMGVTIITRYYEGLERLEIAEGVKIIRLNSSSISFIKKLKPLIFSYNIYKYVKKNRNDIDIIHTHQLSTGHVGAYINMMMGIPAIAKIAGGKGKYGCEIKGLAYKFMGRARINFLRKHIRKIIATSSEILKDIKSENIPDRKIFFQPNGINISGDTVSSKPKNLIRKEFNLPEDKTIYIYVGRLLPVKGIDILLDAWERIDRYVYKKSILLILGDGKLKDIVVDKSDNHSNIIYKGNVTNVDEYLKASDIFVIPSRYEGISNALLEAMSAKMPIIATRVGGNPDLIKHELNGLLVESENIDNLVSAINRMSVDIELRKKLANNAFMDVKEKYSLEVVAENYVNLYNEIIKEKS